MTPLPAQPPKKTGTPSMQDGVEAVSRFLHSRYWIGGQPRALTPAELLSERLAPGAVLPGLPPGGVVVDEEVDGSPCGVLPPFPPEAPLALVRTVASHAPLEAFPLPYAASRTACRLSEAVLDTLWTGSGKEWAHGTVEACWTWEGDESACAGVFAAFYASVEAACTLAGGWGLRFSRVGFQAGKPGVRFAPGGGKSLRRLPGVASLACPHATDWLVYLPFDTCPFRLGGSLLCAVTGYGDATAPNLGDVDCFRTAYALVWEWVRQGRVRAGCTVGVGGLMAALHGLCGGAVGGEVSIQQLCAAYGGELPLRVWFGEVPGVVVQVADTDFDALDADCLRQGVAYHPLGHPSPGNPGVHRVERPGLPDILAALLGNS